MMPTQLALSVVWITSVFAAPPPSTLQCPVCESAATLLARGDTTAAIHILRSGRGPGAQIELLGQLGFLLALTSGSDEGSFSDRLEAERYLARAVAANPRNVSWLYGYGLLLWKSGRRVDAKRALERSLRILEQAHSVHVDEHAAIHALLGRILADHVRDYEGLIIPAADLPNASFTCPSLFCMNFERPSIFNRRLLAQPTVDSVVTDELNAMMHHLSEAVRLDPASELATRELLNTYSRREEWRSFDRVATDFLAESEGKPWAYMFKATAAHHLDQPAVADRYFKRALQLLGPRDSASVLDVSLVGTSDQMRRLAKGSEAGRREFGAFFWRSADPMLLTPENERLLEHLSRITVSELWFGVPEKGIRGYETEMGEALIRFGRPVAMRQFAITSEHVQSVENLGGGSGARLQGGGRWVFWTYDSNSPSLIFERNVRSKAAMHAIQSSSRKYADDWAGVQGAVFALSGFRSVKHQAIRFKGAGTDAEVEIAMLAPPGEWGEGTQVGVAFIPLSSEQEIVRITRTLDVEASQLFVFRAPLAEGRYPYAVEMLTRDGLPDRKMAAARGLLEVRRFSSTTLDASDLLLAQHLEPEREPVRDRRDMRIGRVVDNTFCHGGTAGVYLELYGLQPDSSTGTARYAVRLQVSENGRGLVHDLRRGISRVFGAQERDGSIVWQREVTPNSDRITEWFMIAPLDVPIGEHKLEIQVTDLSTAANVSRAATVTVRNC